jgi:hypothetical protein
MRVTAAFARLRDRLRAVLTRLRLGDAPTTGGWRLVESTERRTRWRRDDRTLDCRRLGDGYVVTVARDTDRSRFQLTPGFVPLASALAVASVYLQHGVAPQLDRDGRPFVAVRKGRPRQVYDPERAGTDVRYVYLDAGTTLDEFPDFLAVRPDVRAAAERMPDRRADPAAAD